MLYLMLDKRENHYYAKVGLAKKPRERRRAYATHNPCAIMRSTCAGMGNEEVICQNKLSRMSICRIKSTEWYEIDKQTFEYLKRTNIDDITFNKAISKICDSYRVTKEDKIVLKKMKKKSNIA